MTDLRPGPGTPTPPIALAGDPAAATARLGGAVEVDDAFVARLADVCAEVTTDAAATAEASRDWWPLAMIWATENQVPARAAVVARPTTTDEVAAVVAACHEARVPLTTAGGRSGVCGASVPVFGGVVLDTTALSGIRDVDDASLVVDVAPGTFGDRFEEELQGTHGLTVGHWPQSMALATVGGWVACRGAGQYSTRYGKIEDIVQGLDVVLADGRRITTGGQPRQAAGPDLTQLFVGSEGTLGVITGVRLTAHPVPTHVAKAAYGFASFAEALDAMRRILRRGATPAVLRLYDDVESNRNHGTEGTHDLLVLDEGEPGLVDAGMAVVAEECAAAAPIDVGLVDHWLGKRNDVAALEALISRGYVVDTMEVTGTWAALPGIYTAATEAIRGVEGTLVASAHQSHSYLDGGCLYFTFAANPGEGADLDTRSAYYRAAWDAGTRAVLAAGGSLSHHHGVGLNRARFVRDALGPAFEVLAATKAALDPHGILNPGKLGLPSPFGEPSWP
ncbi:FAD-binding oxidoreductase [Iamia sp. SCSIO 61187]|uniref:FAD-binding oxidoreductase n=1 Tax=Iamia sp. SCSIO 61187 TaxID=2722752 RepID=UPI001C629BCB|nr:FAD-binding oxidoreductase [Iamia sp. SCSIO 61187]QYG93743.1 FAD-binding oxidoreductase [Iamia sp. SCSIO 61187]